MVTATPNLTTKSYLQEAQYYWHHSLKESIVFIFLGLQQIFFGKSILIQFCDKISIYIFGIVFLPSDHGPKSRKKLHVNQYYFYALRWLHVQQFDHILDLSSFLFERLYFSMSTTTPVIICYIIKANQRPKYSHNCAMTKKYFGIATTLYVWDVAKKKKEMKTKVELYAFNA